MKTFTGLGALAALSLGLGGVTVVADEFNHKYAQGDKVNFYVHKVSPFLEKRGF